MAAFKLTLKTIVEHHRLLRYKLSPRSGWAPVNRKLNRTEPKCRFFQFLVSALAFMSRSFGAQSRLRFEEAEEPSNHTTKERVRTRTYTRQPTSLSPQCPKRAHLAPAHLGAIPIPHPRSLSPHEVTRMRVRGSPIWQNR